jgi:hypothetical protein
MGAENLVIKALTNRACRFLLLAAFPIITKKQDQLVDSKRPESFLAQLQVHQINSSAIIARL